MPQLSIVIPTYNRADSLKRCLQSVLVSTLEDIEILVADNASPDATPAVLAGFDDPRLRHWRNAANVGPARNFLMLLEEARGDWIFCLTDDDYLLPGALERLLEALRAFPSVGVVLSSVQYINEAGIPTEKYRQHPETREFSSGPKALIGLLWTTHLLSRITVRREWMDLAGTERHLGSLYPQMYWVGSVLKDHPGLYLDICLVTHTVGNKTDWSYHPDFMVGARIKIIRDLLPEKHWQETRQALIAQLIVDIGQGHMQTSMADSPRSWLTHQKALWKTPEIARSPFYWVTVARFLVKCLLRKKTPASS